MVAAVRTLERRGVVRTADKLLLSLSEGLGEVSKWGSRVMLSLPFLFRSITPAVPCHTPL